MLFGDSITEEAFGEGGWGASLANHYSRSADVVLRGYSGYNTRWAARVAGRAVASIAGPVSAVTVFFGANDAALPDRACALQHVPLAEYKDNLRAIFALLKVKQTRGPRFSPWARKPAFRDGGTDLSSYCSVFPEAVAVGGRHPHHAAAGRRGRASAVSGRSDDRDVLSYRSIRRAHRRPAFDPDGTEHGRNECRYPYAHDFSGLPERTNAAAAAYARACVEVARQCGLRAIDIWSRMQRFPGWEKSFLRYARTHALCPADCRGAATAGMVVVEPK